MWIFPISPALSICDSLADVDDLDAFLEAKGKLSRFPTPPMRKDIRVEEIEVDSEDDIDEQESKLPEQRFCQKSNRLDRPPFR